MRNDGRLFTLGMALQAAAGTYVPPTNWVRALNPGNLLPDLIERRSEALMGTPFELPADDAGNSFLNKTINGEGLIKDIALMLRSMLGEPAGGGVITPSLTQQFNDDFVMRPMSWQGYVPNAGTLQITDSQISELALTVPEANNANVTYAATVSAGRVVRHPDGAPLNGFVPAVMPSQTLSPGGAGVTSREDHTLTVGGQPYVPNGTSVARFYNPVVPLPYSGYDIPGFGPGTDPVGVELNFAFKQPIEAILAAATNKTFLTAKWRLARGGGVIEVNGNFQISARQVDVGPGRMIMPVTLRARAQTTADIPFTVTVVSP